MMDGTSSSSFYLPYAHPAVRDLAFLLTAPAPWLTGADILPERLLGDAGPQLLAELDHDPRPLVDWLAARPTTRLGRYAENLLAFWFELVPHIECVAANLQVQNGELRTIGEFDFLLRIDGEPWHLETASKFYLMLGEGRHTLVGPSLRDAWALKAAKLQDQLALSRHAAAQALLPPGFVGCRTAARLAGWLFYPHAVLLEPPLAPDPLTGWARPLLAPWPRRSLASRWVWLPRLRWLAPARVDEAETLDEDALRRHLAAAEAPQLVAEVLPLENGSWEEVARGFVCPPNWPPPARLAELLDTVQELANGKAGNGGR
ncbi:DUF1853 family protein [Pseudogulbenkiania subflava]|uniref:DUF1853 domain-containing protein n=1 Tax=Pseudogulbenkiania subflava DSM 22618 TaxID=1123014 RepID=A0A1Y6BCR1_9NEIS|nr:DUF1853 family protein [Pseudogulbenkiania subflava]SME97282.1 hypothetical protein SAMN02745746_00419 [Pseudogulbenkiania subflava DSM 22618]